MRVVAFFDGGCLNSVRAAGAAIVYDEDGVELVRRATYMEGAACKVNVAEYCGLLNALELAREVGATHVKVLGDSELVIRQFNGVYQVRKEHLMPWYQEATRRSKVFVNCIVQELPKAGPKNKRRHMNAEADALSTACMQEKCDLPRG